MAQHCKKRYTMLQTQCLNSLLSSQVRSVSSSFWRPLSSLLTSFLDSAYSDQRHCTRCHHNHYQHVLALRIPPLYLSNSFRPSSLSQRFSTSPSENALKTEPKRKDLRESIERLKYNNRNENDSQTTYSSEGTTTTANPHLEKISAVVTSFLQSLSQTWQDLKASGTPRDINKKIGVPSSGSKPNYANDDEAADKYEAYKGSKDIMVIDPAEHLSAWERMERRLRDAPIIQGEWSDVLVSLV